MLREIGADLQRQRLARNLSQAGLGAEAGVSRDTVRRLEAGEAVSTLTLVRVLRALGIEGGLNGLVPGSGPGPLEQLEKGPAGRRRARNPAGRQQPKSEWRWADEERS